MESPVLAIPETMDPGSAARFSEQASALLRAGGDVRVDCSGLKRTGALEQACFAALHREAESLGRKFVLQGLSPEAATALGQVPAVPPGVADASGAPGVFERAGEGAVALLREWKDIGLLLSESLYHSTFGWRARKTRLAGSTAAQMVRTGSTALPIVLLLSTLIGFTLALQSGLQLEKYGAAIFLADGIGISMITEIGPLITAVILAGRSGSAITAELATMTVQEEVAALRSMAVNPIQFLVLPRFHALTVTQPLLTVAAALSGVFSGLLVAMLFFNISPQAFLNQLQQAVEMKYVWQMLVKSVTFAWLIVLIASVKGMGVRGGADAVGRATTACVVNCIFAIVLADALFSFVFYL